LTVIVIDTSALVSIALLEPDHDALRDIVTSKQCGIGAPHIHECYAVLLGKGGIDPAAFLDEIVRLPNIAVIPFAERHAVFSR
jgi:uncharacterized protein with PIN domain